MNTDQNNYQKIDDQPESPVAQSVEINDEHTELGEDANQLTTTSRRERISSIIVIGILAFLTGMSYTIVVPTAWGYINTFVSGEYSGLAMGLVLSMYALSSAIAGLIFGYMYDIGIRLKRLILVGSLFQIVGNFLYFLGINIYVVVTARFITGIGMGIVPLLLADVSRRSTPESRTQILSRIVACRQFGFIFGPAATIFLEPINFQVSNFTVNVYNVPGFLMATLWFIMVPVTLCFFYDLPIIVLVPKSVSKVVGASAYKAGFKKIYDISKQPVFLVLLTATFIFFFNQSALNTFLTPFATYQFNWGSLQVSILYAFIGLEVLIVYFLLNFISKKFRDQTILLFAFIVLTISALTGVIVLPLLTVGVMVSLGGFILFIFLDMLAAPLINVTTISLITKHTQSDQQGTGLGIQNAVFSLAAIIGPIYAGLLLEIYLILLLSLLMLVAIGTILVAVFYTSFGLEKSDELSTLLPTATD